MSLMEFLLDYANNIYMYGNELFKKFCKERNIKKSTIEGYNVVLNHYVDFHGENINALFKEAYDDEKNKIPLKDRRIKNRLLDFRNHIISILSSSTAKTYFTKVKTFYMHFGIEIPYLPSVQYSNDYETSYFDLPTRKHIREALNMVGIDLKAVILFMSSSGTAKAETLSLTIGDFIDATVEYHNGRSVDKVLDELEGRDDVVPTFYLRRIKTDKYYYTFCSPEATQMIVKSLKMRKNLKNSDRLFDFSDETLMNRFKKINDAMNWGRKGNYRFFRSHTLRKFHASNIGLSAEYVDALQGRNKNPVHRTYIKTNPEKLKSIYKSVMGNVMIYEKDENIVKQEFNIIINVFLAGQEYNIL